MWRYENFSILIAVGLQPFMWWASVQLLFSWYYQLVFGWSTIKTAVHLYVVSRATTLPACVCVFC
jgi:hypothetical protein